MRADGARRHDDQTRILAEQTRLLAATFDASPLATLVVAGDTGAILSANTAAGLLAGCQTVALSGQELISLFDDAGATAMQDLFDRARDQAAGLWHLQVELVVRQSSGEERTAIATVAMLVGTEDEGEERFVVHLEDVTARRAAEREAQRHSVIDPTTGLFNRRALVDQLDAWLHRMAAAKPGSRHHDGLTLVLVDLDDFKELNDFYGYRFGDEILVETTQRVRELTSAEDVVARIGPDEFAIVIPGASRKSAAVLVGALRQEISRPIIDSLGEASMLASFGIAVVETDELTSDETLRRAELALYRAKRQGRGQVEFYAEEMREQALAAMNVREELAHAIAHRTVAVAYQPIVDLANGTIVSYEALVRLLTRDGQTLNPAEFLPVAKSADLISVLDQMTLERALGDLAAGRFPEPNVDININCEPEDLRQSEYSLNVLAHLHAAGIEPHRVTLEVTEGALLQVNDEVSANVASLREAGLGIAIDDFGTGYSSLSQLRDVDARLVKIDRSFIARVTEDRESRNIVATIIELAHQLGRKVTAEGIETRQQAEVLRRMGCEYGQGYLFGRPMQLADMQKDQHSPAAQKQRRRA
ncbi:MAG: bifunctional diguanylate cyclase/phosphodiesterase [Actinomycetia bacterium]|nr:bifunctional diguanylate cyclase/phosphodiesterase [Actinomycetes bacterium]